MKPDATVVISTFNRRDALTETLVRLGEQTVGPETYEVVVVDDGSSDGTSEALAALTTPYALRTYRHETNRGVSAGRNLAIDHARGDSLVLLSDDLLVPPEFIETHLQLLAERPRAWIVGGFRQLEASADTPFGRYLERLEAGFDQQRKLERLDTHLWRLEWPTARNLSLPRTDFEQVGPFDERFRTTCEDQDLAHRAKEAGIEFLYTDSIDCLHNDQAADLRRYCRFQELGASDTVLLCQKYPEAHGGAAIAIENGPLSANDPARLTTKKLAKLALARPLALSAIRGLVGGAERLKAGDRLLARLYRGVIGLHIFRGWRAGLDLWT